MRIHHLCSIKIIVTAIHCCTGDRPTEQKNTLITSHFLSTLHRLGNGRKRLDPAEAAAQKRLWEKSRLKQPDQQEESCRGYYHKGHTLGATGPDMGLNQTVSLHRTNLPLTHLNQSNTH